MGTNEFTYQQMDYVLIRLGFVRKHIEPKWLHYVHSASETEIILVEKKPNDFVRPTDAWSVREHLVRKGLIGEEELGSLLGTSYQARTKSASQN